MKDVLLASLCLLVISGVVSAEFVRGINIDFVTIGNAGNTADSTGHGAVGYDYSIGKCEITNAQWNAFTAAAGVPSGNPSVAYDADPYWTSANVPANNMSWYEAAQFCNYLTSGDKSKGAYLFTGNNANPGDFLGIDRDSASSAYGTIYVIPTEDEWYKAAYYTGSGYSKYANGTDVIPIEDVESNYQYPSGAVPWNVGTGAIEQNGTFDMMGNFWEWNETIFEYKRFVRGGAFNHEGNALSSSYRLVSSPNIEAFNSGLRVVSIVPEPCSLILLSIGGLMLRRRK